MQLLQVVFEGTAALRPQRRAQDLLGHKRIAVAVAADPAADAQEGGEALREQDAFAGERLFEICIEARQFAEEGIVVIGEAVGHLVDHPKARPAQQICLPQGQDRAAQCRLVGRKLGCGQRQRAARGQQVGDFHLAVDRAFAAHLGRMCGQHRHDHGAGEEGDQPLGRDTLSAHTGERMGHGAFARHRIAQRMSTGAADVVPVLGDIGEMGKKAEGTNDLERGDRRQIVQCRFEIAARRNILVTAKADRILANRLDGVEDRRPALLAHRVAEDTAEQPDIVAQRQILVFGLQSAWHRHGSPFRRRSCRNHALPFPSSSLPRPLAGRGRGDGPFALS